MGKVVIVSENIETKPCPGKGDYNSPWISNEADALCPDHGENDEVILLALVLIDSGDFVGFFQDGIRLTLLIDDISDEIFLAIIESENSDGVGIYAR